MIPELDKVREIFLTEVDEETRAENEAQIKEWETRLQESEALIDWRDHDITRQIARQARESYRDLALQLSNNRKLTDVERQSLWAKQDAALWILSLTEKDGKGMLEQVKTQIKTALNATN